MRLAEHNELLEDIFKEVRSIRTAGQKEYAHDEDNCFANFERIAKLMDSDRETVLMTYLMKHIDGVQSYIKGHKSQREDVRGRIVDIIVYLTLLWGMADQDDIESERDSIDLEVSAEHHMAKHKPEWKLEPDRFKVKGYNSNGEKTD